MFGMLVTKKKDQYTLIKQSGTILKQSCYATVGGVGLWGQVTVYSRLR